MLVVNDETALAELVRSYLGLAHSMGVEIRVESAGLCQGSGFTFTLPQAHK